MEKERGIVIVGAGKPDGLLCMRMAEIKAAHPDLEVITIDEAKERGLHQSYEIKAHPPLPEILPYIDPCIPGKPHSSRAARRKAERDAKKRKNK